LQLAHRRELRVMKQRQQTKQLVLQLAHRRELRERIAITV